MNRIIFTTILPYKKVYFEKMMKPNLESYKFIVATTLSPIKMTDSPSGRIERLVLELHQYGFSVKYRKGTKDVVTTTPSRQPIEATQTVDSMIVAGRLYRYLPRRTSDEEGKPWKLYLSNCLRHKMATSVPTH